ncbi:MAG: ribonuclease III [Chloroflexi bacterium]|nr:ribonuclease III [Chloroflexota bacterium]MCL5273305.1 ribonuclease III [Chloroflexota bacterium]
MLPEFHNQDLLLRALTHSSYANEHVASGGVPLEDNERLEFLGDAILDFIAARWLYNRYPDLDEGRLTSLRAALVRASTLAKFARSINLADHLRLGKGEDESGGRQRANILGDTFEALMAALYLDQGLDAVSAYFEQMIESTAQAVLNENLDRDPKSQLQEWSQAALAITPRYKVVSADGPDHAKTFTVEVWLGDQRAATGSGSSKQFAEQTAARAALKDIAGQRRAPDTPASD